MDIVYLGLFSKVLNWVLDKIFNPIFKFISNLLSTVFGWIFDKVLGPIISSVLVPIMNWLIETIFELFAEVFYRIYVAILSLVDTMQMAFDVLIGLTPVKDDDSLLDVLIQNDNISTAFWQIAILGLGIAMMLTIFADGPVTVSVHGQIIGSHSERDRYGFGTGRVYDRQYNLFNLVT